MNFFYISIFIFLIFTSILPSEILKNNSKFKNKKEVLRKISHFFITIVFVLSIFFLTNIEVYFFATFLILAILITKYLNLFSSIFNIQRKTFGVILFPISLIISTYLFLPEHKLAFIFGFLVLGISDSAAAIFGKEFEKKKILKNKTLVGSFVFFLTAFLINIFFLQQITLLYILKSLLISLSLTIIELFLKYGLDNIFIPLSAGFLFILFI